MSEQPFTIRRADRRDLPALGRLGALLLRTHHGFDAHRFMAPGDRPEQGYAWFLGTQLERDDVVILVAERQERVLGYAYAGIEPQSWKELRDEAGFIHDVIVDPEVRGSGMGRALVDAAVRWLAGRGMPRVVLWTASRNMGAHRLFGRLGFRDTMIEMTREVPQEGRAGPPEE
jgi:ribosomal protein S18 acetylase RimI-like enzyme